MKYKVSDLAEKLRLHIGDNTEDLPADFIINAYNYTVNALIMKSAGASVRKTFLQA